MEAACINCGEAFREKGKRYNRTSLFSKLRFRNATCTPAEVLQNKLSVSVTPNRKGFICSNCESLLHEISQSNQSSQQYLHFQHLRKKGSYLSTKIKTAVASETSSSPRKKKLKLKEQSQENTSIPSYTDPTANTIPNTKLGKAIHLLLQHKYRKGLNELVSTSQPAKKALLSLVTDIVRKETQSTSKRNLMQSFQTMTDLQSFSLDQFISSIKLHCPFLFEILVSSVTKKKFHRNVIKKTRKSTTSLKPMIVSILSQILFSRNKRGNSLMQGINSILLWLSGCKRNAFSCFNNLGLCLSLKSTLRCIDELRGDYDSEVHQWKEAATKHYGKDLIDEWVDVSDGEEEDDQLSGVDALKSESETSLISDNTQSTTDEGNTTTNSDSTSIRSISSISTTDRNPENSVLLYDITFDNINQKTHSRHPGRQKHGEIFNMVQAYATKERIPTGHLSPKKPTPDEIRSIELARILPDASDNILLQNELKIAIERILGNHFTQFLDADICWEIAHPYSKESRQKSKTVPLGILRKDENKTADMIEIMAEYHKYLATDDKGDPVNIPLFCDGLSCERGDLAKKSRTNAQDNWAKLNGLEPSIQEWHLRQLLLQDTYSELVNIMSLRTPGTLYHTKQVYGFNQVSSDISSCFNHASDLLHLLTKAHVIAFAESYFTENEIDLQTVSPEETNHILKRISSQLLKHIYTEINVKQILNVHTERNVTAKADYCICQMERDATMIFCENPSCGPKWYHLDCIALADNEIPEGDYYCSIECKDQHSRILNSSGNENVAEQLLDRRSEYARRLLWFGLNDIVRHDAVKENDGTRILRHWRFDLCMLFQNHHPKYVIYAAKLLFNSSGAASTRLAAQLTWNRTVNVHGGRSKNMEKDLHMEHLNKIYKEQSKVSAGQLTDMTIQRHSQMTALNGVFRKFYKEDILMQDFRAVRKTGENDASKNLNHLVKALKKQNLFKQVPSRKCPGFNTICHSSKVRNPKKMKMKLLSILEDMANTRALESL